MNEITFDEIKRRKNLVKIKMNLVEEYGGCQICNLTFKPILQIHHIEPVSTGGTDDVDNLLILCPNCHKIIHALDGNYYDADEDFVDIWMDNNLHPNRKQVYLHYATQILKSRYRLIFDEVMSNARDK